MRKELLLGKAVSLTFEKIKTAIKLLMNY